METTGDRIRLWRRRRGMSQQTLAGLSGVSQAYVSQVERGLKTVERRSTLARLAAALNVSVAELTGTTDTADPVREEANRFVPAIREALLMRESGDRLDEQVAPGEVASAMLAEARCEYTATMAALPRLLRIATGSDLVDLCRIAMFILKNHGYPDLARDAARLGVAEARRCGDPAILGVSAFTWVHSLPVETCDLAARSAQTAADELQPYLGDPKARQIYGMLHLSAGLACAASGRPSDARDHVAEARAEAELLGEPDGYGISMLVFGPANVGVWRMSIAAELGQPDEVVRASEQLQPAVLPVPQRRAQYHALRGCALAQVGGHDEEAVLAFLRAEEVAPQWTRLQAPIADAVVTMLRRARRGVTPRALQRLATAFRLRV